MNFELSKKIFFQYAFNSRIADVTPIFLQFFFKIVIFSQKELYFFTNLIKNNFNFVYSDATFNNFFGFVCIHIKIIILLCFVSIFN